MTDKRNDLGPVIITEPGDYITRAGARVTIHEIDNGPIPYTFPCKGSVWRMFRGKYMPKGYQIWMRTGFLNPVGMSMHDIVGKWEGA